MGKFKSKAHRPKEEPTSHDMATGQGPDVTPEEEARLTAEEITAGVE